MLHTYFCLTDERALESPDFTEYKAEVVNVDSSAHDLQRLSSRSLVQPQHRNIHREEGEDSESDPDVDDVYCALMPFSPPVQVRTALRLTTI